MEGYSKLFSSIVSSTIWREDPATKIVWITMLALKNQDGIVEASIPGLAHLAGVTLQEAEIALGKFLAPDPYSRSREHDGRRIADIDGGWLVLNHDKYRKRLSPEDIREKNRIRQQRHRETSVTQKRDTSVTRRDERDKSRMSRDTDSDTDADADSEASVSSLGVVSPSSKEKEKEKGVVTANAVAGVEGEKSNSKSLFSFQKKRQKQELSNKGRGSAEIQKCLNCDKEFAVETAVKQFYCSEKCFVAYTD